MNRTAVRRMEVYRSRPDVEVVAVVPSRAAEGDLPNAVDHAAIYADESRLLREDVDVVELVAPNDGSDEFLRAAVERGIHAFLSRPFFRALSELETVERATCRSDASLMVEQTPCFAPEYQLAKRRLEEDTIGEVGTVRTVQEGRTYAASGSRAEREGFWIAAAVEFDWLHWLFGDARRVYAQHRSWVADGSDGVADCDHATVVVRFDDGIIGHVAVSSATTAEGPAFEFEIVGTDGSIAFDSTAVGSLTVDRFSGTGVSRDAARSPYGSLARPPWKREVERFLESVRGEATPPRSFREAVNASRITDAAIESASRDTPITVSEVEG